MKKLALLAVLVLFLVAANTASSKVSTHRATPVDYGFYDCAG